MDWGMMYVWQLQTWWWSFEISSSGLKMKGKPEKLEKITADFTHEFEYVNI